MNRTIQLACFLISAVAILVLVHELSAQTERNPNQRPPVNKRQAVQQWFADMQADLDMARNGRIVQDEFDSPPRVFVNPYTPTSEQKKTGADDQLSIDIPKGFCLAGLNLDVSSPIANSLRPGQNLDVYFIDMAKGGKRQVKRLISGATLYSIDGNRGAPHSIVTLLLKIEFAESFLYAQKNGELELTITGSKFEISKIANQSLDFEITKAGVDVAAAQSKSKTPRAENESIEQITKFRDRVGSRVRNTLNEIEEMTGGQNKNGSISDKAFQQRLQQLFEQKNGKQNPSATGGKNPRQPQSK